MDQGWSFSQLAEDVKDDPSAKDERLVQSERCVEQLRETISCKICTLPMYEPYTTQCGHTFCYDCLARWFDQGQASQETCPDCRAKVTQLPAPAFAVREFVIALCFNQHLLPTDESVELHQKAQREEASRVQTAKSAGSFFSGRFVDKSGTSRRTGQGAWAEIRDEEDGVARCPECFWELEHGECNRCLMDFNEVPSFARFDDAEELSEGAEQQDYVLRLPRHNAASNRLAMLEMQQQENEMDDDSFEHARYAFGSDSDMSDDEDEDDGSEGSLRDFVEPDESEEPYRGRHDTYRSQFGFESSSSESAVTTPRLRHMNDRSARGTRARPSAFFARAENAEPSNSRASMENTRRQHVTGNRLISLIDEEPAQISSRRSSASRSSTADDGSPRVREAGRRRQQNRHSQHAREYSATATGVVDLTDQASWVAASAHNRPHASTRRSNRVVLSSDDEDSDQINNTVSITDGDIDMHDPINNTPSIPTTRRARPHVPRIILSDDDVWEDEDEDENTSNDNDDNDIEHEDADPSSTSAPTYADGVPRTMQSPLLSSSSLSTCSVSSLTSPTPPESHHNSNSSDQPQTKRRRRRKEDHDMEADYQSPVQEQAQGPLRPIQPVIQGQAQLESPNQDRPTTSSVVLV